MAGTSEGSTRDGCEALATFWCMAVIEGLRMLNGCRGCSRNRECVSVHAMGTSSRLPPSTFSFQQCRSESLISGLGRTRGLAGPPAASGNSRDLHCLFTHLQAIAFKLLRISKYKRIVNDKLYNRKQKSLQADSPACLFLVLSKSTYLQGRVVISISNGCALILLLAA